MVRREPSRLRIVANAYQIAFLSLAVLPWNRPDLLAQEVRFEERGPSILDRVVLLGENQFTFAAIEALAQQFVRENQGQYLYRLTLACSEEDLRLGYFGRIEKPYVEVIEILSELGPPKKPMAQVLGLGKDALLRYRDATGLKEKILAGTKDPTLFRVSGIEFRLVHFKLTIGSETMLPTGRYVLDLFFTKVSGQMSVRACATIVEGIRQRSSVKNLGVKFRSDTWFLQDALFPYFYPFVADLKVPDALRSQYIRGSKLGCYVGMGQSISCSGSNFVP